MEGGYLERIRVSLTTWDRQRARPKNTWGRRPGGHPWIPDSKGIRGRPDETLGRWRPWEDGDLEEIRAFLTATGRGLDPRRPGEEGDLEEIRVFLVATEADSIRGDLG